MTLSGMLEISGIFPQAIPSVGGMTPQGRVPAADYSPDISLSSLSEYERSVALIPRGYDHSTRC